MHNSRFNRAMGLPAFLLPVGLMLAMGAVSAPSAAKGADGAAAAAPSFGSVDLPKIQNGYAKRAQLEDQMNGTAQSYKQRWDRQQSYTMLTLSEQQQLGALLGKPQGSLSDQEKATVQSLENKSGADTQALAALQQKGQLSDADKAQLANLQAEAKAGTDALSTIHDSYMDAIKAEQDKVNAGFGEQVRAAIAAVAKDRGLTVVFDSQVAIYCSNDITDQVLARLNK